MKVVSLTDNIRFFSLEDNEGSFGLLVDVKRGLFAEVYTKEEFTEVYNQFVQF